MNQIVWDFLLGQKIKSLEYKEHFGQEEFIVVVEDGSNIEVKGYYFSITTKNLPAAMQQKVVWELKAQEQRLEAELSAIKRELEKLSDNLSK